MLHGYKIIVGVTGGIAAYKTCTLVSMLTRAGADVHVLMTKNAAEFVSPLTFETLSRNRVSREMFSREVPYEVEHIALAANADLFVILPATANAIAKLATGLADDLFSTTALSLKCPFLVCPAMNFRMLEADATQANLEVLKSRGVHILEGESGYLACGEEGKGRAAEPEAVYAGILRLLSPKRDYEGKKVLVTAGGTREDIDGVRCLTNYSSGKMGAEIADAFCRRGAIVTVVRAHTTVDSKLAKEFVDVETTRDMFRVVTERMAEFDIIVKAAAPSDYRVESVAENKIKSERVSLQLIKNPDIAEAVGKSKRADQKLVIFCAETENLIENAKKKRTKKDADMVVANNIREEGAGFDADTNIVTVLTATREVSLPMCSKREVAEKMLDMIHDC